MAAIPDFHPRAALLGLGLALAAFAGAIAPLRAAEPAAHVPRPQMVFLRVQVGPDGKIVSSTSLDPNAAPVLVKTAQQLADKLVFAPASKEGRAVASETTLVMTLAFALKDGGFAVTLKRAQNGPNALAVGSFQQPKVNPRENGGVITVSADLRADGSVDMETFKVDKAELRVPASFAQEQFEKSARAAMKGARFQLDKVDGIEVPSRVSVPFSFNGGAAKRKPGEDDLEIEHGEHAAKGKGERPPTPLISATSRIEGIVLPKLDYTAPETPEK
jgi:hypothetical protein